MGDVFGWLVVCLWFAGDSRIPSEEGSKTNGCALSKLVSWIFHTGCRGVLFIYLFMYYYDYVLETIIVE